MNTRADFLKGLFQLLDARGIPYCVLRNYEKLFAAGGDLDVDLLVNKSDVRIFDECLLASASGTGQRLVQRSRFVNYSRIFLSEPKEMARIDFDTEIRWRVFPVLSARKILAARQKFEGFYVPHPRHEAIGVLNQMAWSGKITERYRNRMAYLHDKINSKEELRQTYREAFGGIGEELAGWKFAADNSDATLPARLRRSLKQKTLTQPAAWFPFLENAVTDSVRLVRRWRRPGGISVLCVSVKDPRQRSAEDLLRRLEFLFPAQNWAHHTSSVFASMRRVRQQAMFKGGVYLEHVSVARDEDIESLIKTCSRFEHAGRQFIFVEDSRLHRRWIHAGSGFQVDIGNGDPWLIGFMAELEQKQNS